MKLPYKILTASLILIIIGETFFLLKKSTVNDLTTYQAFHTIKASKQNIFEGAKTDTEKEAFIVYFNKAFNKLGGTCTPYSDTLNSDYVKVQINFKGSNLYLDKFLLGIWDYASQPGCFQTTAQGISMINYIKTTKDQKSFPFELSLRSVGVINNMFEYSAIIFDKDGKKILGKFPAKDASLKGPIPFLKYPIVITDTIKYTR